MPPGPTPADAARPPGRWVLAPGLRVVRRGTDRLQVGLTPPRRVVLPRTRESVATLDALVGGGPLPRTPGAVRLLDRLHAHDCLRPASPPASPGSVCLLTPAGHRVEPLHTALVELAARAGLRTTRSTRRADVVVVLGGGEPPREDLDPLVRDDVPHLLLRLLDGGGLVGPFVDPGRTACQRCLDAHAADDDPEHPAVLARYVAASQGPPAPDPVLATLLAAWAVRDVLAWGEHREPSSWSTTWALDPGGGAPRPRRWPRHPRCGCAWPGLVPASSRRDRVRREASRVPPSGTMEA